MSNENESNKEEKSTTFKKHKNSRSKRIVEKINQYKEYSTTMDHRDTDSQLKSSKREQRKRPHFLKNNWDLWPFFAIKRQLCNLMIVFLVLF